MFKLNNSIFQLFLVVILTFCFIVNAIADPWLDEIIYFDQPEGSSNDGGVISDALGITDNKFVSIDIPEVLIVAFTNNSAFNGEGDDLEIFEISNGDSFIDVYISCNNVDYKYLGSINGNKKFDLDHYSIKYVNYIKFVGIDDGGGTQGFDLDGVKALHSMNHIESSNCKSVYKLISTFDTDDEGWRLRNDVNLSWKSTGGTNGGFLQGNDIGDGRIWYFVSPISWSSDWSSFNSLTYDFKLIDRGSTNASVTKAETIKIIGVNGKEMNHSMTEDNYPNDIWKKYSIPINPGSFDVTNDIFESIIQNVKELWIRGEYTGSYDIEGLDNVILKSSCELSDLDLDGVIDQWDKCIKTSNNSATYSNGCIANDLYSEINFLTQQVKEQKQILVQKNQKIIDLNAKSSSQEITINVLNSNLQAKDLKIRDIESKLFEANENNHSLQSTISYLNDILNSKENVIQENINLLSNLNYELNTYKSLIEDCSGYKVTLTPGWHLISSTYKTATPITIPEGCIEVIYGFNNGAYEQVTILKPMHGYWIKISDGYDTCEFILQP